MKGLLTKRRLAMATLLLTMLSFYAGCPSAAERTITVIISPTSDQTGISLGVLRAIFGMRLHRWPDGAPVKVFVFVDDAPEHEAFTKELLQVFPRQLRQSWERLVFSGLGQYPEYVSSEQEMLDKVASTPGAVGYVTSNKVNANVHTLQIR